jgi:hypothetical protein
MKTWINHAIPKTKNETMTWEHLLPPPARKFKATPVRNTASVFRKREGALLVDFIHRGNTVTAGRCCGTLARLQEAIRCNWRGLIRQCVVRFHDDRFHTPNRGAASRRLRTVLPSPHFALSDFYPLRAPKKYVAGKRFAIAAKLSPPDYRHLPQIYSTPG